jgi:hypothetical protein
VGILGRQEGRLDDEGGGAVADPGQHGVVVSEPVAMVVMVHLRQDVGASGAGGGIQVTVDYV